MHLCRLEDCLQAVLAKVRVKGDIIHETQQEWDITRSFVEEMNSEVVGLNVGGQSYRTHLATLLDKPQYSLFSALLSTDGSWTALRGNDIDEEGRLQIPEGDGSLFRDILCWLRYRVDDHHRLLSDDTWPILCKEEDDNQQWWNKIKQQAQYFGFDELVQEVIAHKLESLVWDVLPPTHQYGQLYYTPSVLNGSRTAVGFGPTHVASSAASVTRGESFAFPIQWYSLATDRTELSVGVVCNHTLECWKEGKLQSTCSCTNCFLKVDTSVDTDRLCLLLEVAREELVHPNNVGHSQLEDKGTTAIVTLRSVTAEEQVVIGTSKATLSSPDLDLFLCCALCDGEVSML